VVDVDVGGWDAGADGVAHQRYDVVVGEDSERHPDDAGDQADAGDGGQDHADRLPWRHAECFEDSEVVDALPGVEHDDVEYAEAGDRDDHQGKQGDERLHGDDGAAFLGVRLCLGGGRGERGVEGVDVASEVGAWLEFDAELRSSSIGPPRSAP
jgi:hypothetical protein